MSLAVIEPRTPSLDDLAVTINHEHELAMSSMSSALTHAIACGEALEAACALVPRGTWWNWLEENFEGHVNTAGRYRRIARRKAEIQAAGATSMNTAKALLKGSEERLDTREVTADERREVRDLIASGYTQKQVGEMLGIAESAVRYRLRPETERKRKIQAIVERRAAREAHRKALERDKARRIAKAKGGNIGKAWSQVHLLAETLDRAALEDADPGARAALADALALVHKAEYKIDEALRLSKAKS